MGEEGYDPEVTGGADGAWSCGGLVLEDLAVGTGLTAGKRHPDQESSGKGTTAAQGGEHWGKRPQLGKHE